jgi:hypothetical protein
MIPAREFLQSSRSISGAFALSRFRTSRGLKLRHLQFNVDYNLEIYKPGSSTEKTLGCLVISLEDKSGSVSNAAGYGGAATASSSSSTIVPAVIKASPAALPSPDSPVHISPLNRDPLPLATTMENAEKSVASLRNPAKLPTAAAVIDRISTASSNDTFDIALGIVDNFIKFGDILAEVILLLAVH